MTKQDKVIAGILLAHSFSGIAWTFWAVSRIGIPTYVVTSNLVMAMAGLIAGIGSFKGRRWAALLGLLFFTVQLLHIVTPSFTFSLILGFNLSVSFGHPGSSIGLNLFALVMLAWACYRVFAPNSSFKPKPLRGSA